MLYTAHMEARGREGLMACWGNAHETLRRHRWQKLVGRQEKDIISGGQTCVACMQTRTPQATGEFVVYRKAQGKRNPNQSIMLRVDCKTSLWRLAEDSASSPQSKCEIGATRIRR